MGVKKTKLIYLSFVLSLPFLSGCQNQNNKYLDNPSYSFSNGRAICEFESKGYKEFNLYSKAKNETDYSLIDKISSNTFSTDLFQTSFKVVPLANGEEDNEHILEIKAYFDMVFDNDFVKIFTPDDEDEDIQTFIDEK